MEVSLITAHKTTSTSSHFSLPLFSPLSELEKTTFFIISFNFFTKDLSGAYFPCEMGVVTFSIFHGLTMKCHSLIDPGPLPLGHAFAAKDHSEKTHKLPPPPRAVGDTDYVTILCTLTDFLKQNTKSKNEDFFPLLVMENEMEVVNNVLAQFCDKAEIDSDQYVLLPLTYFFQRLRETCEEQFSFEKIFPFSFAVASSHLERDIYQYHKGNGCPYHEEEEINIHCALSRPTRWAYIMLDQTMHICDVKNMRDGLHFPIDASIAARMPAKKEESDDSDDHSDKDTKYSEYRSSRISEKSYRGRVKDEFDERSYRSSRLDTDGASSYRSDRHEKESYSREKERDARKKQSKHRPRRDSDSSDISSHGSTDSYRNSRKMKIKPDPDRYDSKSTHGSKSHKSHASGSSKR